MRFELGLPAPRVDTSSHSSSTWKACLESFSLLAARAFAPVEATGGVERRRGWADTRPAPAVVGCAAPAQAIVAPARDFPGLAATLARRARLRAASGRRFRTPCSDNGRTGWSP